MVMLAGQGNGKTHVIDELCNIHFSDFFDKRRERFQNRIGELEKKTSQTQEDLKEISTIKKEILQCNHVEKIVKEQIFFVPVSFNVLDFPAEEESRLDNEAFSGCRMLYFFFSHFIFPGGDPKINNIRAFYRALENISSRITPSKAVEIIRHDLSTIDEVDSEAPVLGPNSRAFVLVDEIAKLSRIEDRKGIANDVYRSLAGISIGKR